MSSLAQIKAQAKRIEFAAEIGEREFDPKVTMHQLVAPNRNNFFCWGVSKKVNYANKALMLQVNARRHKGKIWIALAWDDTYTIYLTTDQMRVKKTFTGIYFDMLNDVIDREIEAPI